MNNATIELSDLLRRLAKKWKLLLCFMLIAAVIAGAYGYRNARRSFENAQAQHIRYAEAAENLPGYFTEELYNVRESVRDPKRIAFAEAFAGLYRSFIAEYGGEKMFSPEKENMQAYMMFLDSYKDVISVMSGPERTYFEMLASLNLENNELAHPVVNDFSAPVPSVLQMKWIGIGLFLGLLAGCFVVMVSWKPERKNERR